MGLLPQLNLRSIFDYLGFAVGLMVTSAVLEGPFEALEGALRKGGGGV